MTKSGLYKKYNRMHPCLDQLKSKGTECDQVGVIHKVMVRDVTKLWGHKHSSGTESDLVLGSFTQ